MNDCDQPTVTNPTAALSANAPVRAVVYTQGAVLVNDGRVYRRGENIVAVYFDLVSKWAEFGGAIHGGGKPPIVCLDSTKRTSHVDEGKAGETTLVEFPEFIGWTVFSANVSGYTLAVVFVA